MATIGSLTGSTSNSIGSYGTSVRGYGGLASGLDTDSLIQGMTMGTRSKIASLLNKKQTCQWQTAAYRSVSDKLIEFKKKYISGESGPSRPSFFDRNLAAANGANSKYLDIKGASDVLENMTVVGIKSLAKDTTMTTNGAASDKLLTTGDIAIGESTYVPKLEGENIKITYGTTTYTLNMKSGQEYKYKDADGKEQTFVTDYTTPQKAVDSLNKIMENTELKIGGKLSDKVKVSLEGGKMTFKSNAGETNDVIIGGGSAAGLKLLGLMGSDDKLVNDGVITETGLSGTAVLDDAAMMREVSFGERIGGKTISFSLNGSKRDITMPDQATVESWGKDLTQMQDHIQKQMDTAFGKDKVTVAVTGKGLSFHAKDDSSVLKITGAGAGMLGASGALGINNGASNRLHVDRKLGDAGFQNLPTDFLTNPKYMDAQGKLKLSINNVDINADGKLTKDSSMQDIMDAINRSAADVTIKYLETSDRFTMTSTRKGGNGKIELGDDLSSALFGVKDAADGYHVNQGTDAIVTVEYEGGVQMDIRRDTNSFDLEGSTFTLKGEFGFQKKTEPDGSITYSEKADNERITFTTSIDTDKVSKVIADMVKDYNEVAQLAHKLVGTKPDRDYGPLSDEQKKDMTEDQIKIWEEKAKEGILFNDSLVKGVSDGLRSMFSGTADIGTLKKMGFTLSTDPADNGKVTFNEEDFKAALLEDPNKIKQLFTQSGKDGAQAGIAVKMKDLIYEYANDLGKKGSLLVKAGSTYAPLSMLENSLQKEINEIDKSVKSWKVRLQSEMDRYTKQFSSLEQLISQMNSQSSQLSSMMG